MSFHGRTVRAFAAGALRALKNLRTGASKQSSGHEHSPQGSSGSSPGQFGSGATRDLTAQELRGLRPSYAPALDGAPDPGEVVWTWVPYVENDGRGKDRPVLILARLGAGSWAACYLTTKQQHGFVSVGSGAWDAQGRESFMSPERVLRVTEAGMRREAAAVSKKNFVVAVRAVLQHHRLVG